MVIRGHVIQLVTTPVQEDYLARAAGVARFAYNWALEAWQDIYLVHTMDPSIPNTSEMELRRELNALKEKRISVDAGSDEMCSTNGYPEFGESV